ncbi:MAG: hypothetical protein R3D31_00070 [Hyphomicrobiaceae bacterium]
MSDRKDPNAEPPFPGHRRYYLAVKIFVVVLALLVTLHLLGYL